MVVFDAEVARSFLEDIFCFCPPDEWVSIFAIDRTLDVREPSSRKVLWAQVRHLDELVAQVPVLAGTHCIWFGVATRKAQLEHGRGGADNCAHLPVLFADIDIAGPNHKGSGYPPDEEAVRAILSKSTAPTMIVATGGGYHPYWVLDEPWVMPQAALNLREWGNYLTRVARELGYELDNVFNVDRVLRLAGTTNWKDLAAPAPAVLLKTL